MQKPASSAKKDSTALFVLLSAIARVCPQPHDTFQLQQVAAATAWLERESAARLARDGPSSKSEGPP